MTNELQIHVDLETLDTKPTARILSIGAVCNDSEFYCEVDQSVYGDDYTTFTESDATKEFWAKQGGFQSTQEPVSPFNATSNFFRWCVDNTTKGEEFTVWANSPSFDCSILAHHATTYTLALPWRFWQERDVRTIKGLAQSMRLPIRMPKNPHNALQDAKNQQALVLATYNYIAVKIQKANECTCYKINGS